MLGTTIILAFRAINRHKLRSFLTTLGIIIGVAAVVTMVTLGNGATAAVRQQISSLGANVLQLRPGQGFGRGGGGPRPPDFKPADLTAIENQLTGVRAVAPLVQSSGTAIYEGSNWSTTVYGTTAAYFEVQSWKATAGRLFMPEEEEAGKPVCIIGNT
ncbi:MAG TPA: ABC transporter permease, partial [Vineibacter sp.]|nr:ABC transporter permease [Vineibacter sp.]